MPLVVRRMADLLRHRGPDDDGVWADTEAGIALAQRRLAIVDLSPAGHQPMFSACQRYVIVFNGEIYNYEEIRRRLEAEAAHAWRGHSDTEVLLEAIARWGLKRALELAAGMFALRAVGPPRAHARAGARPARRKAALLRPHRQELRLRLRAEGVSRPSRRGIPRSTATRWRC